MADKLKIAIIGGGIGGLVTAAALRDSGHEICVYEQAEQFREIGAGVTLHPNATRLLEKLGLGHALRKIGSPTMGVRLMTAAGNPIETGAPRGGAPLSDAGQGYNVHRAEFLDILVNALPSSSFRLGQRCADLVAEKDRIALTFENGASVTSDLVIGADGIRSVVRQKLGLNAPATSEGVMAYRGMVPVEKLPWAKDAQGLYLWMGAGRSVLCYPVSAGTMINMVAFVPTDRDSAESWSALGDLSALAAEYRGWDERVGQTIAALSETYIWGIYDRPALQRWTSGHTTLIGDAAHPMVPHLGQGAGQAIEDAYTLGVLLKGASKDTLAERLASYERLRRDHTARVQTVARQAGQFYRTEFPDPRERDATMGTWMKEVRWILEHDADATAVSELERSRT
ncbi:FAD-dependent monooxygenase [Paraburkholderia haematera]|uniref:Salicylate hydroxylase n=1 Tax=Paraburkholderia haematera TaxID=2793077 RepID=A0ABM8SQB9_9BURK|nr:FAD-dependent monooxygenase [Paraburkholderia haematera]CAE6825763.1 Salicylate hydroxylase [Paraburkholderia haematera]